MFLGVGNFFSEQTKIFLKPANSHLFLSHARKPGEEPLVAFDLKVKLFSLFSLPLATEVFWFPCFPSVDQCTNTLVCEYDC